MIPTGGEKCLSNFLLWKQLCLFWAIFLSMHTALCGWPDFDDVSIMKALNWCHHIPPLLGWFCPPSLYQSLCHQDPQAFSNQHHLLPVK
jgi:hypothetical protein